MNKRNCYCDDLSAEFKRTHHIEEGFCGVCSRCGAPGHTRHYPGPVPATGEWCDRCYRITALTWPFTTLTGLQFTLIFCFIMFWVVRMIIHFFFGPSAATP